MSFRLKKRVFHKNANVFQFMKIVPGPKSNKDLYNHALEFLMHGHGTPQDAIEMLEDFGVDHKKAIGMVRSIVKEKIGKEFVGVGSSRDISRKGDFLEGKRMSARLR